MGKLKIYERRQLRFTVETNASDFLERAGEFIARTEADIKAWKWVVLSLHGALYGFAISACKGTDYESLVQRRKKGERLIPFQEAIKKCQDEQWMGTLCTARPLILSENQKDSIKRLQKALRNNFEHYVPRGWSIEIHGLPRIAMDILDVIRFLAIESGRYQHLNQTQRRRIKSIVFQSKKLLRKSILHREALLIKDKSGSAIERKRSKRDIFHNEDCFERI